MPNPENPETEVFNSTDVSVNGQNFSGLDQLPPELQARVKTALGKMQSNPNLMNMLSSFGDLAKAARQNGIGVSQIKSTDHAQLYAHIKQQLAGHEITNSDNNLSSSATAGPTATPTSFENAQPPRPSNRYTPASSTYNPMVKGDGLRKAIFMGAAILLIGYLIIKFGYNGKLPF